MPADPQADKDFLAANPKEQHAYLLATDPDYAKAPATEQSAYLQHLTPQQAGPSTYDKLTSPLDPGAEAFDKAHPIMGKPVRAMSALGGAVMGLPGSIYHSMADPLTPEEEQDFKGHTRIPGEVGLERLTGARQMVNAGRDYAGGKVSPSAAMSVLPEALGQGVGTVAGMELGGRALGAGMERIPQTLRTGASVLEHQSLQHPFKAAMKLPEYWREASPANRMLRASQEAVAARQAGAAQAPPVSGMKGPEETAPARAKIPPVKGFKGPAEPEAVSTPRRVTPPPVRYNVRPAEPVVPGRMTAPPLRYSLKPPSRGAAATTAAPITYVPEPTGLTFEGQDPNYFASSPRNKLGQAAMMRKPGAGTQMQQLGQPIIYIPNEADYPGPRR